MAKVYLKKVKATFYNFSPVCTGCYFREKQLVTGKDCLDYLRDRKRESCTVPEQIIFIEVKK